MRCRRPSVARSLRLSFSHSLGGNVQPTPINPNDVVSGMGDMLGRTIGPHIRIETRLEPGLWNALADRAQIEVDPANLASMLGTRCPAEAG